MCEAALIRVWNNERGGQSKGRFFCPIPMGAFLLKDHNTQPYHPDVEKDLKLQVFYLSVLQYSLNIQAILTVNTGLLIRSYLFSLVIR